VSNKCPINGGTQAWTFVYIDPTMPAAQARPEAHSRAGQDAVPPSCRLGEHKRGKDVERRTVDPCARWLPPGFNNGLDPDTTEGAIDLVYDIPNFHVEYVRVEPPAIPTAFWRSVGPSHNVFVTESFIDELAAAAKQDPVVYRRALLGRSPRGKAVLDLAAEKAGWGQPLPDRAGRGIALQFAFGSYMAHIAEVEASKDGRVRVRRVVCAVDCGIVVNPDTVRAQIQSASMFGITAALYGKITLKNGRVEQSNFDSYQMLRIDKAPSVEVHIVQISRRCVRAVDARHDRQADPG
jgi:isoquinoline 1-oxidoreductase subunit beta